MTQASDVGGLAAPRRNHFFYSKLMGVLQFQMDQQYGIQHRWLMNRLSLGTGVLCGLGVTARDKEICIAPGVAINALGQEIIVASEWSLDPWSLTDDRGAAGTRLSTTDPHTVYICLAYYECATDFMPVTVTDCNAREQSAPGTIVESFRVLVREAPPAPLTPAIDEALCAALTGAGPDPARSALDRRARLCAALTAECLPGATGGCVHIATVTLGAGETIETIDACTDRPVVYSNALLFELILCLADRIEECCGSAVPPTTTPPTTTPPTTTPPTTTPPTTTPPTTTPPTTTPPTTTPPTTTPPTTTPPTTTPPTTTPPTTTPPTTTPPTTTPPTTTPPTTTPPTTAPPTTTPPTTAPPTTAPPILLRVQAVEFLSNGPNVLAKLARRGERVQLTAAQEPRRIQVTFTRSLDGSSVTTVSAGTASPAASFLVVRSTRTAGGAMAVTGTITIDPAALNVATFSVDASVFTRGAYRVTLFGDPDAGNGRPAIADTAGGTLDGDEDNAAGGSFEFGFTVT